MIELIEQCGGTGLTVPRRRKQLSEHRLVLLSQLLQKPHLGVEPAQRHVVLGAEGMGDRPVEQTAGLGDTLIAVSGCGYSTAVELGELVFISRVLA
jgi:hypothetical protein